MMKAASVVWRSKIALSVKSSNNRYRRDTRTKEEFEHDIIKRTLKEEFLCNLFLEEVKLYGRDATAAPLGNKDAGKITEQSNCDADYQITIDEKTFPADIKNCGIDWKMTYKVYDLEEYIKQGAYILCFLGTGYIDDDPTKINYEATSWVVISPTIMQSILDELPHYKDKHFGFKICVQVRKNEYARYFKVNQLKYRPKVDKPPF